MRDACLLVLDVQNDFMPGGALAVQLDGSLARAWQDLAAAGVTRSRA